MKKYTYLLLTFLSCLVCTNVLSMEKELEKQESNSHSFTALPVELQQNIVALATSHPSLKQMLLNFYSKSLVSKEWKAWLEIKPLINEIFEQTNHSALKEELGIHDFESSAIFKLLHDTLKNKLLTAFFEDDCIIKYIIMRVLTISHYSAEKERVLTKNICEYADLEIDAVFNILNYLLTGITMANELEVQLLTKMTLALMHGEGQDVHGETSPLPAQIRENIRQIFRNIELLHAGNNNFPRLFWGYQYPRISDNSFYKYMHAIVCKKQYFKKITLLKQQNDKNTTTTISSKKTEYHTLDEIFSLADKTFLNLLDPTLPIDTIINDYKAVRELIDSVFINFNNIKLLSDLLSAYAIECERTELMPYFLPYSTLLFTFSLSSAIDKRNAVILNQLLYHWLKNKSGNENLNKILVFLCINSGEEVFNILLDNLSEKEKQILKTYYETGKLPQKTLSEKISSFFALTRKKPEDSLEFTILLAIAVIKNDFETIQYYAQTTYLFRKNIGMLIMLACKEKNIKMLRLLEKSIIPS